MNDIDKIKNVIETLRPYINYDGGDIEFIKYEDKYVYVKLSGACSGCSLIDVTLKDNVYEAIKEEVPDCLGVIKVDF